jgi:hypothetical protein
MKKVCKNCFADIELIGFIISRNQIGNCSFCESKKSETVELSELVDFFKELFENFHVKKDGKSLITLIQETGNLFSRAEIGAKILNDALAITENSISSAKESVDFSSEIIENIEYWNVLKEQLKWEKRYFTNTEKLIEDLGWDGFFESKTIINNDVPFYRARLHLSPDEPMFPIENMSAPCKSKATAGRANPMGIPYLYLSDNKKTILHEIRALYLDEITIGTFTKNENIQEGLLISDFTQLETLYHPNEINNRIKSILLKRLISKDLSKPLRRYDSDLEYIPTQFICEFIKIYTNVQGIKFKSSLHNLGSNLVLFNPDAMICRNVKKSQISKVDINSEEI